MASRFVTVSEGDILATNEAAVTISTKKATWLVGVNRQVETRFLTEFVAQS